MRLLMLSGDPHFLAAAEAPHGGVLARHLAYAAALAARADGGHLLIAAPGPAARHDFRHLTLGTGAAARRLLRVPCDAITAESPWDLRALAVARARRIPLLAQLHFDPFDPAWQQHPANRARSALARLSLAAAARVRVMNAETAAVLAARWRIPQDRIWVAPVPVTPLPQALSRREELVVGAMRLASDRAPMLWLEAAARIAAERPAARFVLAGDGAFRTRLERAARTAGIALALPGALGRAGLAALYAKARLFLHAAPHEAFGRALVEAQLAGLPPVAFATAGARAVMRHGETGLLAPSNDLRALADAAVSLLAAPARAEALGQHAVRHAAQQFDAAAMTDRVVDFWLGAR